MELPRIPNTAVQPAGKAAMAVLAGRPVAVHSFPAWRAAARVLLAGGIAPAAVHWVPSAAPLLPAPRENGRGEFEHAPGDRPAPLHLPRAMMAMLHSAACCRVPDRWAFLYRVVWRWRQGEAVLSATDGDGARLHAMVTAVQREEHDMVASIRFRERPEAAGPPRFVAWCAPAHDVLPRLAAHFVKRMDGVSWMIATPEASVLWDGAALHDTGPLLPGAPGPAIPREAPWMAWYRGAGRPAPDGENPATLDQCRRCELWRNATQPVGGAGSRRARIMLVGEQPGDQEDLAGLPFVGPAGKLLDRAMAQAGVDRRAVYLTNAVKHFKWEPRGKRRLHKTPAQREIEACGYWLDRELAAVRPAVIVALGSTALKAVLGTGQVTLKERLGQPIRHQGRWVVTVYHPSYVLRVPDAAAKEQAFGVMVEGLKLAKDLADKPPPAAAA